ncbi:glutarate dioxygenase GlaH [Bacillus tianshenii]|nr:glutarate dioxygenase GlaH [Bacillus tianshenii]
MNNVVELKKDHLQKYNGFEVKEHPEHDRLYQIEFQKEAIQAFIEGTQNYSSESLEYVPYTRFLVAEQLLKATGPELQNTLRSILNDRATGGFTTGVQDITEDPEDYIKLSTALTHLIGTPNFDAMTGTFYARFTVKHTDDSDSYLRQAYRLFTLHTDGTFVEQQTDWLLMMKFAEENAVGGRSRLLHLDDWEELNKFYKHPLAKYKFKYQAPPSKNVSKTVYRQTFFEQNNAPCMCFIDQFAFPETIEQAKYLQEMSDSLENDSSTIGLELPPGDLVMLNNTFWMHGREAFERNPNLHRELLRQRGSFAK